MPRSCATDEEITMTKDDITKIMSRGMDTENGLWLACYGTPPIDYQPKPLVRTAIHHPAGEAGFKLSPAEARQMASLLLIAADFAEGKTPLNFTLEPAQAEKGG